MIPIFNIQRELWNQKPNPWGNFSSVQGNLFEQANRAGINPANLSGSWPLWERAGHVVHNYTIGSISSVYSGASWSNDGGVIFDGSSYFSDAIKPNNSSPWTVFLIYESENDIQDKFMCQFGTVGATRQSMHIAETYGHSLKVNLYGDDHLFYDAFPKVLGSQRVYAVSQNSSAMIKIYADGKYYGQSQAAGMANYNAGCRLGSAFSDNLPDGDQLHGVLLINSCLTQSKIAPISDNIWQLWQPQAPVFYSFAAESGLLPINLIDGKIIIKNSTTDLLDGKVQVKDVNVLNLDGKIIVQSDGVGLLDGKVQIKDIATDLLDGKIVIGTDISSLFDGKVQIKDTVINLLDGKVVINAGDVVYNLLDGKVQIKFISTDLLDGLIVISNNNVDLLDGKLIVKQTGTSLLDGKIQIKDITTDLLDGKITIKTDALNLLDGKIVVSSVGIGLLDGKCIVKDSGTVLLDGKLVIVSDAAINLLDGKIIIRRGFQGVFTVTFEIDTPSIGYELSIPSIEYEIIK